MGRFSVWLEEENKTANAVKELFNATIKMLLGMDKKDLGKSISSLGGGNEVNSKLSDIFHRLAELSKDENGVDLSSNVQAAQTYLTADGEDKNGEPHYRPRTVEGLLKAMFGNERVETYANGGTPMTPKKPDEAKPEVPQVPPQQTDQSQAPTAVEPEPDPTQPQQNDPNAMPAQPPAPGAPPPASNAPPVVAHTEYSGGIFAEWRQQRELEEASLANRALQAVGGFGGNLITQTARGLGNVGMGLGRTVFGNPGEGLKQTGRGLVQTVASPVSAVARAGQAAMEEPGYKTSLNPNRGYFRNLFGLEGSDKTQQKTQGTTAAPAAPTPTPTPPPVATPPAAPPVSSPTPPPPQQGFWQKGMNQYQQFKQREEARRFNDLLKTYQAAPQNERAAILQRIKEECPNVYEAKKKEAAEKKAAAAPKVAAPPPWHGPMKPAPAAASTPEQQPEPRRYIGPEQAAKILGVSPEEVLDMRATRELYGYRDGGTWKFKVSDVENLAKERRGEDSGEPIALN